MKPRTTLWMPAATLTLISMGCSDPAPTPAAVGFQMSIHDPNTPIPDSTCPVSGTSSIGNPQPNANPISPGTRITDGRSGVEVSCAIKGSGTFSVSASFSKGAETFTITGGTVDAATGTGTFNLSLFTPYADQLASEAAAPCTFDVMTPPLEVSKGNLFARFHCPSLWYREMAPHTACGADGVIVLEFCQE